MIVTAEKQAHYAEVFVPVFPLHEAVSGRGGTENTNSQTVGLRLLPEPVLILCNKT